MSPCPSRYRNERQRRARRYHGVDDVEKEVSRNSLEPMLVNEESDRLGVAADEPHRNYENACNDGQRDVLPFC